MPQKRREEILTKMQYFKNKKLSQEGKSVTKASLKYSHQMSFGHKAILNCKGTHKLTISLNVGLR